MRPLILALLSTRTKIRTSKIASHTMTANLLALSYQPDIGLYFSAIEDMPSPVWLDSSDDASLGGRYDIISAAPDRLIKTLGSVTEVFDSSNQLIERSSSSPFGVIRNHLAELGQGSGRPPQGLPFAGGALGYFGYGLGQSAGAQATLPDLHLGIYLWALIIDRKQRNAWVVSQDGCNECLLTEVLERFRVTLKKPGKPGNTGFSVGKFKPLVSYAQYSDSIKAIRNYIVSGDSYQVNYAQRFEASCSGDPLQAYLHLRSALPSHYSAFMKIGSEAVLSFSPECFLSLDSDKRVITKPIKGTAPRLSCPQADFESSSSLLSSEKNRAENVMIVDLMRNDLSKVCDVGSVTVEALCQLESFANVHHLVSRVAGTLKDGIDALSLLESAFPAGSITGAPKIRSMEIIDELEPAARSVYCGSIGYIGFDGAMDTSVAIRTLEVAGGTVVCRGGGGIVLDSNAKSEYQESLDKVGRLMEALEEEFS